MSFEMISDLHKDARGFRPGAAYMEIFNEMPYAEQERVWDALCEELADREREEAKACLESQRVFEIRINGMVDDYGISRATALRWDLESFDVDIDDALRCYGSATQEIEHYLYRNGIAFSFFSGYVEEIEIAVGLSNSVTEV